MNCFNRLLSSVYSHKELLSLVVFVDIILGGDGPPYG
jgi:hypothetical protein